MSPKHISLKCLFKISPKKFEWYEKETDFVTLINVNKTNDGGKGLVRIIMFVFKRPKINKKEAGVCPFFK